MCNLKNSVSSYYFPKGKILSYKIKKFIFGIPLVRWKLGYNNHIHLFSHEHLRNQTALSKHVWKLKNMGLTLKIQWKILKRSTTPSCFDGRCNLYLEEKIQIILYFDPGNLLNKQKTNSYDLLN